VTVAEVEAGMVSTLALTLVSNRDLVEEGVVTMAITHEGVVAMEAEEEDVQATVVMAATKASATMATIVLDVVTGPMVAAMVVVASEEVMAGVTGTFVGNVNIRR
jgi:hypothetical protein